jgi:signal peptidase I
MDSALALYRIALRFYPASFRRRYGTELEQAFRAQLADAPYLPTFLFATAQDLLLNSLRERIVSMTIAKLGYATGVVALFLAGSFTVLQAFVIPSASMAGTLIPGDHVLVRKHAHTFEHGEIMVFRNPKDPAQDFIKRVIGLPGDHIRVEGAQVYRNGTALSEPYAQHSGNSNAQASVDVRVPAASYFVLGDNRDSSLDSRTFGFVPQSNVIGQTWFIYWSYDALAQHPRWDRTLLKP